MHETYVKVDEEGTEAAAVSWGSFGVGSSFIRTIRLNHPFLFFIHDKHNIFFIGAVKKPSTA